MSPNEKAFVSFVRESIGNRGMTLHLRPFEFVFAEGVGCRGYFDESGIVVAKKDPRWVEVLAHEYSHFIQWRLGSPLYRKCFGPTNNYADVVDGWAMGKDYGSRKVRNAFEVYRAMERECEMMTTGVLKSHDILFDLERYKREANCMIYTYHFMETHRITAFTKSPYRKSVLRRMPSSFRPRSHVSIPKEIKDILSRFV